MKSKPTRHKQIEFQKYPGKGYNYPGTLVFLKISRLLEAVRDLFVTLETLLSLKTEQIQTKNQRGTAKSKTEI